MKSILSTVFFALVVSGLFAGSAPNPADLPTDQMGQDSEAVKSGWLGVSISDVTKRIAEEQNLKSPDGAYVTSVVDDSPADSIGLKKGDVIVSFAGRQIYDADDLSKSVKRAAPGTTISLGVIRKGEKKTLSVVLSAYSESEKAVVVRVPRTRGFHFFSSTGSQGMVLMALNDQLAQYFEVPEGEGVLVQEVKKSSAAEKAGIKAGDVLLRIAGKRVDEASDVPRILGKLDVGAKADIELLRKGSKKTVSLAVEEQEEAWSVTVPEGSMNWEPFLHQGPERFDIQIEPAPDVEDLHMELRGMEKSMKQHEDQMKKSIRTMVRVRESRTI